MYRKNLLYVTLSLIVYLAMGSSDEILLEEGSKMLANDEILWDKIAKVNGEAIILNNTETETTELYENMDHLNESESFGNTKEKLSKARINFLNESVENIEESTTIDSNHTEVIYITNTTSDFETISKAPVDFVEPSGFLKEDFNLDNTELPQQQSIDDEEYITTEAITEGDIKSTEITSEGPYNVSLNSNKENDLQMSDMKSILSITTETVDILNTNYSNSDSFSTTEYPVKTDKSDNKLDTEKFSIVVDTNNGIVEHREIEHGKSSDVLVQDDIISQSTEYSSQDITVAPVIASTTDFISSRPSKVEITSQTSIEPNTELVTLTKTLNGTSIRSSTNTTEIRNSPGDKVVDKNTKLENLSPNSNKTLGSETRNDSSKVNASQTTTIRSTELHNLSTTAPIKLSTQSSSKPKKTALPLDWYGNLIPIYPIYLLNPLKYFYNSTNQILSGPSALPTTLNYSRLLDPPIFNFTNLLSQTLLPAVTPTARHGFFRQNQLNSTNFNFFPFFKLFNGTHHFNKTKFATNTQNQTAFNANDVLSALFLHKDAKFQQRQTDQGSDGDDGTVFVRRQWYTPLVSDNLERSEGVPFLTPIVRYSSNERPYYRNQGQQMLTPVITYVERGESYRFGGPQYYREKPKLVKRPTTYREQPYYHERPYNIERPYQVEHAAYYPRPIKTDVRVQSGPISYESSPMHLSYMPPVIDIDDGDVEYYYRSKQLNATSLKTAEDKPKEITTSLVLEVEVPNPIYKFMKSIYNLFMPNN